MIYRHFRFARTSTDSFPLDATQETPILFCIVCRQSLAQWSYSQTEAPHSINLTCKFNQSRLAINNSYRSLQINLTTKTWPALKLAFPFCFAISRLSILIISHVMALPNFVFFLLSLHNPIVYKKKRPIFGHRKDWVPSRGSQFVFLILPVPYHIRL